MRSRYLAALILTCLIGPAIFFYASGPIRGYGGDVVVVIFLYALLGLILQAPPLQKAGAVFLIALAIEVMQIFFNPPNDLVRELLLGSSFDPLDIVAYGIGLMLAVGIDKLTTSRSFFKHD